MKMSVISSSSSPSSIKEENRVESGRIMCTAPGCNQTFSSAGDLAVHKQKHQMTLKLGPTRTGLTDMLPFDQTPTPTKFLQFGKETGLFEEISNPFDSEFKRSTLREKARRSAVPGLIIDNKARPPTSLPLASQPGQPVAQPVHVITLTPTLPSPVIPGSQIFIPPLPSPQGFLPSPAALISPSIVPFSAPGLFPSVQAVVEHAALTQAFLNAANSQALVTGNATQHDNVSSSAQSQMSASRTSSVTDLPNTAPAPPFPTQNVSIPVNNNPTPPTCHAMSIQQNMPAAQVGNASVIQQHGQPTIEHQRRPLSQSNSLDHPSRPNTANMERKPSFHGETSVITQAPAHSSTSQMNTNMNMHPVSSSGFPYMPTQQSLPPFSQIAAEAAGRMTSHPVLTSSRSVPTQSQNHQPSLPHQNSLPNIDAKQKLKETLTSNNPNLHIDLSMQEYLSQDEDRSMNEVSSSSGEGTKTGRRRGRQTDLDPDTKRMRFLERNRAAASRCRAKKKQWVNGLEAKAKELSNSNVSLQSEVAQLREEVASLKQLLLAHRDCPITRLQQQKLAIAGGDPSAVVSNPVQAAASLLGIEKDGDMLLNESSKLQGQDMEVKPDIGGGNIPDNSLVSSELQMQTSVLVNSNHNCKSEHSIDSYPSTMPQVTSTAAIALSNSFNGSNPNLSATAGT